MKDERGRVGGWEGGVRQFTCEGEWTNEVIAITTTTSLLLYISHSPVSHLHTVTSPLSPPPITITRSPGECRFHSNTTHTHCHQILLFYFMLSSVRGRDGGRKGGREGVREGGKRIFSGWGVKKWSVCRSGMWSSVCLSAHIHRPIVTGLPVLGEEVRREGRRGREEEQRGGREREG